MVSLGVVNFGITASCMIGLALSIYAYVIELALEQNDKHKAFCDISEHISCTKAFKSPYGKGFGLFPEDSFFHKPNSLAGLLFYSLLATLAQSNSYFITQLSLVAITVSNLASLYFAYILYFKLYDLCIVCVSIYVVNFLNMFLAKLKLRKIVKLNETDQKKKRR